MDRMTSLHTSELERLRGVLAGREGMVELLQSQLAGAHGSIARTAVDAAVATANGLQSANVTSTGAGLGSHPAGLGHTSRLHGHMGSDAHGNGNISGGHQHSSHAFGSTGLLRAGVGGDHAEDLIVLSEENEALSSRLAALTFEKDALASQLEAMYAEAEGLRERERGQLQAGQGMQGSGGGGGPYGGGAGPQGLNPYGGQAHIGDADGGGPGQPLPRSPQGQSGGGNSNSGHSNRSHLTGSAAAAVMGIGIAPGPWPAASNGSSGNNDPYAAASNAPAPVVPGALTGAARLAILRG